MSKYYSSPALVVDGDVAYADDVNEINQRASTAFDLVQQDVEDGQGTLQSFVDKAQDWAEEDEDVEVEAGEYSAKHHALKAAGYVVTVAGSASTASAAAVTATNAANAADADATSAAEDALEANDYAADAEIASDLTFADQEAATLAALAAGVDADAAAASATLAGKWANEPEDSVVSGGEYSAKHYAAKAAAVVAGAFISDVAFDSSWNGVTLAAPSKNAVYDQMILKAALASPTFTGTPAAPTAAADTNTTQIANCVHVYNATRIDKLHAIGNAGTTLALTPVTYDSFSFTCDQATLALSVTSMAVGRTITLIITGGDNCTITWPSGTKWPNGTAPTLSSGTDRVVMQRVGASTIHAALAGAAYA